MKRMNNRGFSLMELIIVLAMMSALMVILTPQFLKYIEGSRVQKDESFFSEVESAAKVACSVKEVYDALPPGDSVTTITISDGAKISSDVPRMEEELHKVIPEEAHFVSNKYREIGDQTIQISVDATRQIVIVTNSWETVIP